MSDRSSGDLPFPRIVHSAPVSGAGFVREAAALFMEVGRARPRIHCITNAVAQTFTANLLLAVGAVPSMTVAPREIADFTARADALLINLGTLDSEREDSIPLAIETARQAKKPFVLDPVFIDTSPRRACMARMLLKERPAIVRANAAEFQALTSDEPSFDRSEPDAADVVAFAREQRIVLAMTGPIDHVADGNGALAIANGHPIMSRVTAIGCAGTALITACLAVSKNPRLAAVSGLLALGIAGEIAAEKATGPGSFPALLLDALASLDASTIEWRAKLKAPGG